MKKIIVIGAGGHSRSVCDIILQEPDNTIIGLIDSPENKGFWGIDILGNDDVLPEILRKGYATYAFVAIGDNQKRHKISQQLEAIGYTFFNAISPSAFISPHAQLGEGIAVMPGATIGPNAKIGSGCIINTNASVDHDDQIGEYCHIAPGVTICGTVAIGDETFIGAGAKVIDGITIGSGNMIGAGAAVIKDLPNNCTAVGVPAKTIKQRT